MENRMPSLEEVKERLKNHKSFFKELTKEQIEEFTKEPFIEVSGKQK